MDSQRVITLFARQAIYDRRGSIYAYELLYRNTGTSDLDSSGDDETSLVITQLFSSLDINTIVGPHRRAYINFTHNHLVKKIPTLLPKDRIGIEVLETVTIDKALLDSLHFLKEQGYLIALDDFVYKEGISDPLIELADVIKIDVLHQTRVQIEQQLLPLIYYKGKLLAEKIESREQFSACFALGFDYFQGFFLKRPDPLQGHAITESRGKLIQLLAMFNEEHIAIERVVDFVLQIPKLSYRILRLANSVSLYRGKKVESLLEAMQKLGLEQIRNWLNLFLVSSQDEPMPDLLERTLVRAKMCESLARLNEEIDCQQAYTVGLFSTLDLFLNEPISLLLDKIPLSKPLNEALLYHKGPLGRILHTVINYEQAHFNQLENEPYAESDLVHSYLEGIEYACAVMDIIYK